MEQSLERHPTVDHRRTLAQFIEMRRQVLRYARTFPRGPERNQHRQVAVSLRRLFRNEVWRDKHIES